MFNVVKIFLTLLFLVTPMFLSACSSSVDDYKGTTPTMRFDEYFNGPVKAWGIVQDRKGKVIKKFDIDLVGTWNGDNGTLDEKFHYYDGKEDTRSWKIRKTGPDTFVGTASDIKGEATGESRGNAIRWNYVMKLPVNDTTYDIKFDDWMFLMNDGVLVNRSYMYKFGIRVGELTIFMQKK